MSPKVLKLGKSMAATITPLKKKITNIIGRQTRMWKKHLRNIHTKTQVMSKFIYRLNPNTSGKLVHIHSFRYSTWQNFFPYQIPLPPYSGKTREKSTLHPH